MLLFPGKVSTLLRVRFSVKVLRKIQINPEYFLIKPKPFYILHRFQFTKQNSTFSLCVQRRNLPENRGQQPYGRSPFGVFIGTQHGGKTDCVTVVHRAASTHYSWTGVTGQTGEAKAKNGAVGCTSMSLWLLLKITSVFCLVAFAKVRPKEVKVIQIQSSLRNEMNRSFIRKK